MTKKNPIKQKTEAQAIIQVQEVKEVETVKTKPVLTIKEKIDKVIDSYEDEEELKKQVFQLVQHILYPEQFCPNCDERMFFNPATSSYNCPNCGYQSSQVTSVNPVTSSTTPTPNSTPRQPGKVPEVVEKAIAESEAALKETGASSIKPSSLGNKIRKLVADRDAGGPAAPTAQDEARVKNSDRNVANKINWV